MRCFIPLSRRTAWSPPQDAAAAEVGATSPQGRQCGGCRGGGRLRPGRNPPASRQSGRRRLHADPVACKEQGRRHRLPGDGARAPRRATCFSTKRRGRHREGALQPGLRRRAGHGRRAAHALETIRHDEARRRHGAGDRLAEEGSRSPQGLAFALAENRRGSHVDPSSARIFPPGGRPPTDRRDAGQPDLAARCAAIAEQGAARLLPGPDGRADRRGNAQGGGTHHASRT